MIEHTQIFSDEEFEDIFRTLPTPLATPKNVRIVLENWARGVQKDNSEETYNLEVREELLEVSKSIERLKGSISNLSNYAEIRLWFSLGRSHGMSTVSDGSLELENIKQMLDGLRIAVDTITEQPLRIGRPTKAITRMALAELMMIWKWATGRKTFGESFDGFAETPLSITFEWKTDGQTNIELRRSIQSDMNKNPDRYKVHYLP